MNRKPRQSTGVSSRAAIEWIQNQFFRIQKQTCLNEITK